MATLIWTAVKCMVYGLKSDLARLPPIAGRSRATSVLIYRLTIAWLHFVQPLARIWGRVRGVINPPDAHANRARERPPDTAGRVNLRDIADACQLCLSLPLQRSYWSQRWVEVADLLRTMADRLRQQRAVKQIELDSGWWEDRDVTIIHWTWFRLDVRGIVEDHGGGKCLHRLAIRSRLTTAAALPLLVACGMVAALRQAGLSWPVALPLVSVTGLVIAAMSVLSTSRVVLNAMESAAASCGMSPVPSHQFRPAIDPGAIPAPSEPKGLAVTTRAITRTERLARVRE
jgi:hypothetical protein